MKIHRSYLPVIRQLTRAGVVAGMAHITGGGITENLPRILPKNISAEIDTASWPLPPLFAYLQQLGNVPQVEMLRTFNLGIGLIAVIPQAKWKRAQALLGRLGEPFHVIGQAVKGDRSVRYRA
jgi:phosphoribosylformylglycinamidine cyclo-ligase